MRLEKEIDRYFGEKIRTARLHAGLTQVQLASELKVAYQTVQKCENGTIRITAAKLASIAEILNLKIGYFFDDLMDEPSHDEDQDLSAIIGQSQYSIQKQSILRAIVDANDEDIASLLSIVSAIDCGRAET